MTPMPRMSQRPGGATGTRLAAESEATDDLPVALDVIVADVVEQSPTTSDQLQETTTGVVVSLVNLEMFGEVDDALTEDGDLYLGGSGIGLVETVLGDGCLLVWHVGSRPLESW